MATGANHWVDVKPVSGFRLGTAMAGIKKPHRRDLVVMSWDEGSTVAGVFTPKPLLCRTGIHLS